MHVRFVSSVIDRDTRIEAGFINTFFRINRSSIQDWIWRELRTQIDWYNDHLDAPDELGKYFKRRSTIWGICWFKPEATECIRRAYYCSWLLEEAGIPMRVIKTTIKKEIIWQDTNQILSKPTVETPRAF